jgi:hypothetical protein
VANEERRKWDYMTELIKDEEREKRNKIRCENERLDMEKKEKKEKALREAERKIKRERTRRAMEEEKVEEDARNRNGKYPCTTQ